MLEEYEGGEQFFDNLDANIQHETIIYRLLDLIPAKHRNIIVSGKFGRFFSNWYNSEIDYGVTLDKIIAVEGGLRKGIKLNLDYMSNFIRGKEFIFIDDSFYSGKTRDAVKSEIERHSGKLANTYVVYDGSKEKDGTVHSLYRYYDNH